MSEEQIADLIATAMRCATIIVVSLIFAPVIMATSRMLISYLKATDQEGKQAEGKE